MRTGFSSTPNFLPRRPSRGLVVLSVVVLAISVTVSLLFAYSRTDAGLADPDLPKAMPELQFETADGTQLTLADFRGRVVLLNVWATWCAPCRKEMPALDRLQAQLGGPGFEVLALSIDRGGLGLVRPFFEKVGVRNLAVYLDRSSAAMSTLHLTGVPTTLLIDPEGREVRRWIGPAEWDSPEMVTLLRRELDRAVSQTSIRSSS